MSALVALLGRVLGLVWVVALGRALGSVLGAAMVTELVCLWEPALGVASVPAMRHGEAQGQL